MRRAAAYAQLVDQFGAGEVADRLLAKWISDPDADDRWEQLHAVVTTRRTPSYLNDVNLTGEVRERRPHKYWVILWLLSMGYTYQSAADQLGIALESVKQELKYARKSLELPGCPMAQVVAEAIRLGLIP